MPFAQNDNELILLYKKEGDLAIVGELYSRYASLVYGVCLKYLKDRDEAKDMAMQMFEKLTSTVKTHEIDNFKSWLYVSARNQCLMQIRKEKGKFKEEISDQLVENNLFLHPPPENELEDDLSRLEKCIQKLVDGQKQCVEQFYLQEKCYQEISSSTGYDMNKVKSYIQNGKRNLKICMEAGE
jgi:RNA polymerase sigma-70 factor (ECF subfamily)